MLQPKLAILSLAALAAALDPAAARPPTVEFAPPGLLERRCVDEEGTRADPAVVVRVRGAMAALRAAWGEEGPALLEATEALTGQPFGFGEALATLHACPGLGSLSAPLLIDAGRYFESDAEAEPGRRALRHFTCTVWHELTHRQIGELLGRGEARETALLRRYAGESAVTKAHLHLFALEQLVYRLLGREEEFHARGRAYGSRGNPDYARAYAIVLEVGAEAFVAELSESATT